MADNDHNRKSEKDLLAVVFDPNVDFKNFQQILSSVSSPELSYFGILAQSLSNRPKRNNFGPDLANSTRPDSINYSFDEENQVKEQLIKNNSTIIDQNNKVTNSSLAEVHRFKLPAHCLNKSRSAFSYSANPVFPISFIQSIPSSNPYSSDNSGSKTNTNIGNYLETLDKSYMGDVQMEKVYTTDQKFHPAIHLLSKSNLQATQETNEKYSDHLIKSPNMQSSSKPHLIIVPHEDQSGHQHEVIQEVYRYPPESLETVVERKGDPKASHSHKLKQKSSKKKLYSSRTSLESSNSIFSSKSISSLTSQGDSLLSPGSSTNTLNISDSGSTKSGQFYRGSGVSFAYQSHGRCENEIMSDTSSNVSTMSDLSGYEDEYTMIKRLVSDDSKKFFPKNHLTLNESLRKKSYLETKVQEQEGAIKALNCNKEDLEIQVHRLTVQLQNAVREKDICHEHLDILQTKLTEKNQQEYFELLKVKVNLEGQNETLEQELQHYSLANSEFEAKLRESEKEKESFEKKYMNLLNTEKQLKKSISNLEQENIKYKTELKQVNEALKFKTDESVNIKTDIEDKDNIIKDFKVKYEGLKKESENYLETIKSLKKWNSEYSEREQQHTIEKKKLENLLSESAEKLSALKKNSEWYQEQLNKSQKMYSEIQNEFAETKSSLSIVSEDRYRCKREVERLNTEIEDNRVKAMRDKSLLLVQLEELEADMRERESIIKRLEEGDKITHVKLSEERYKKLEEDHKQLQELKIELRDILRHNDSLKEESKHKIIMLRKNEETIRNLRKDLTVTQEEFNSQKVFIDSLKEKLKDAKIKVERAFDNKKENEAMIGQLKEQRLQLEASALTAEQDKKQVDETIARLKEDMSKLSSNFFRMKHDLSAKDKQIELISTENLQFIQSKKELTIKLSRLEAQLKESVKKENVVNDINLLKESLSTSNNENTKLKQEISQLRKSCDYLEVEKRNFLNSLNLRDEQIDNMQGGVDTYKEKILQKDEEIFKIKDQFSKFEKNYSELQKKFNILNNDYQLHLQEKDELNQLEINYKNTVVELKDNVKMEKRAKDNLEKKYMDIHAEFKDISKQLQEKEHLIDSLNKQNNEFEKKVEGIKSKENEITNLKNELDFQNNTIMELHKAVNSLKDSVTSSEEKFDLEMKLKYSEIAELKEKLSSKMVEIERLEIVVNDLKQKKDLKSTKYHYQASINKVNGDKHTQRQNFKKGKMKILRDENPDPENMRHQKKDTLNLFTEKGKGNEALNKDHKTLKFLYDKNIHELGEVKKNFDLLKNENETLSRHYLALERDLERVTADLTKKNEESNEWKDKFENLSDTIPQRDTNGHQKSSFDHRNFSSSYQGSLPASVQDHHERTNLVDMKESCLQDFNLEERVNFSQTMVYLQKQISFAAEALKNKDLQIIGLNEKVSILSASKNNDEALQKKLKTDNENYFCDVSTSTEEAQLSESPELEELRMSINTKELEFKEKKRRYESNLRLLTRKLKEHMKGRRVAEKELEVVTQKHKKNLDEEGKKYEVLKNKFLDLEKKLQHLESKISLWESIGKDKDTTIENLTKGVEKERQVVLQMQKEIGKIEQLESCMGNLRSEINELNSELSDKDNEMKMVKENLQIVFKERKILEDNYSSACSQIEELTHKLEEEAKQVAEKDKIICLKRDESNESAKELSNLRKSLEEFRSRHTRLEEDLGIIRKENGDKSQKLSCLEEDLEAVKSLVSVKCDVIEDLNGKKDVLEREIQIKQETIDNIKSECATLRKRVQEVEEKHQHSISLCNKKLLEAKEIESSLNTRMSVLHKEKLSYQTQCTELKIALNSALEKLQAVSMSDLPSPSPLNTDTISKLMEQCSKPKQIPNKVLNTLTEKLNSLRDEVSVLQTEIISRDQT